MENNRQIGFLGESAACDTYIGKGYIVADRNWRYKNLGELDIVLIDNSRTNLVICEVKLRKNDTFAPAELSVNIAKQNRIRKLTELYLLSHPSFSDLNVRFDIATVYTGTQGKFNIEIIEDAF